MQEGTTPKGVAFLFYGSLRFEFGRISTKFKYFALLSLKSYDTLGVTDRDGAEEMKRQNNRWVFTLLLAVILLGGGGLFLWRTGFFEAVTSQEGVRAYIDAFSPYTQLAFFVIQLLSVILAPIPSNITAAAGALIFGMWESFFLTAAAVLLGSMVVFLLAHFLGRAFADQFVSRNISEKYLSVLKAKRDAVLILVFLFPFFPDDLICILAGLTDIAPLRFLVIILLTRPWGLLVASAVGGSVISIPLWGMVLIGALGVVLFVVGIKFGDQWERKFLERWKR